MTIVVRDLHKGMGQAVAERTILRPRLTRDARDAIGDTLKISPTDPNYFNWLRAAYYSGVEIADDFSAPPRGKPDIQYETWADVADRVAMGNALLREDGETFSEYEALKAHLSSATILLSGRHLQHGDASQPTRNQEVFTNCSTAAASFLLFNLLLNGSGVGRDYSNAMVLTNFDYAPSLLCVLDDSHSDFQWGKHESLRDAKHKYGKGRNVIWHTVADTREGWAQAIELYEVLAFQKVHAHKFLVLDFSKVRPKNSPIKGMQMRPSSGPVPLMDAIAKVATLKGAGLAPWHQAIIADHYLAECVLVGGARRSARMSTKWWRDHDVIDFIEVKRPIEYQGLTNEQVVVFRANWQERFKRGEVFMPNPPAFLWSSNNSVTVDESFWTYVAIEDPSELNEACVADWKHAKAVYQRAVECAYYDGTGEPGFINVDKLVTNGTGWDYTHTEFVGSKKLQVLPDTRLYLSMLAQAAKTCEFPMITNPCGEIALTALGGYCVISDVVPFHAASLDDAEDAFRVAARALIRVNTMDCIYRREVERTNRIGVGQTGVHEFAWKYFRVGFRDLVSMMPAEIISIAKGVASDLDSPSLVKVIDVLIDSPLVSERVAAFWLCQSRFGWAIKDEATSYSAKLGVTRPHTDTTIKPAGTTSKLFGLTEGWHLPPLAEYLRWVQFKESDPIVEDYEAKGYPVRRDLKQYRGMVIVGFPTIPTIAELGMGDKLVLAGDATPEEQFKWLMLGEFFFIQGIDPTTFEQLPDTGNQISYTLKYKPDVVSFEDFKATLSTFQPLVRACSVMPQEDGSAYEYLPEENISKAEYERMARAIAIATAGETVVEDIGKEHIDCSSGACPIDFSATKL